MRARIPAAALAFAATACTPILPRHAVPAGAEETGFRADPDAARLVMLEYALARYFAKGERPWQVACAAASRVDPADPSSQPAPLSPDAEKKLQRRFPGLSPLQHCVRSGLGFNAADTGEGAAVFNVDEFVCETPIRCEGFAGYYANGPHGWRRYRADWRAGRWVLSVPPSNIVLTGTGGA